jgi:ubiquitin-conjugating enzyme E2 variant
MTTEASLKAKSNGLDYLYNYTTENYMDRKHPEIRQAKKEMLKESYTTAKRLQEIGCFIVFLTLLPVAMYSLLNTIYNNYKHNAISILFMGVQMFVGTIAGILFADFMSGLFHWFADTWGNLDWPVIGKTFIRSFREHHVAPSAMCNHDVVETNGDSLLTLLIPLFLLCRTDILRNSSDGISPYWFDLASYCFWLTAIQAIAFTNQFHKWAHTYRPPAFIAFLQNRGIILSKENHLIHHRPAFDGYYCITTGWLNPILEKINFWKFLEKIVSAMTGLIPREDDYKWTGLVDETPDVVKKYINDKNNKKDTNKQQ